MERDEWMPDLAGRLPRTLLGVLTRRRPDGAEADDDQLAREFEARLLESSTLAFRVAFGVLRHRQDAEDVAQEAFARAHRSFRQLRDRDRFRAWLVRMTWRLAINRRRADQRRVARESILVDSPVAASTDDDMAARERAQRLWQAIDALPEKLRMVIVLAGIEEHDVQEVARLLGLPPGTVKSRMFLGRRRLKELLHGHA
jgi:RNA polymerase sigma-70 factor (ECF subfamily)